MIVFAVVSVTVRPDSDALAVEVVVQEVTDPLLTRSESLGSLATHLSVGPLSGVHVTVRPAELADSVHATLEPLARVQITRVEPVQTSARSLVVEPFTFVSLAHSIDK